MARTIRVLYLEPNKDPEVREITNSLKAMQELVGGYIEYVVYRGDLEIVCNEEGRLMGLPLNRRIGAHVFVGPIFFTRTNSKGDNVDITDDDIKELTERWHLKT